MNSITDAERRRRLAVRHRLAATSRSDDVAEVADAVVALHSSDPASVFISACARLGEPSIEAVERALYDDRTVVRHHAMRRTLWVMNPDVAQAANAGFTRRIAAAERPRTARLFGRDEAWLAEAIERVVQVVRSAGGPIATRDVGAAVPDLAEPIAVNAGKSYEGTMAAHTRALLHAAFEGRIVRARPQGTWIGSQYAWVANEDWLALDWSAPDELEGATEVVRRWLERFGPGTLDDVAWWTGGTKGLVRRALDEVGAALVVLEDGSEGFVLPGEQAVDARVGPWVALLPGLDPTVMGWKRRDWYLSPDLAARVTDRNGNIGPTVWVDGSVVGGWVQRPDGTIAHDVDVASLSARHARLLDEEIERLRSVLGETRVSVRFPAPNQRALLAGVHVVSDTT